ncbi:hypothetical protein C8Q76DRAFT_707823 [Earliella scabrosa]|nr:hypothetical protein C8Q76DRAFT_707823 [Earliella scabrosa]
MSVMAASRGSLIVSDLLVISVTWTALYKGSRDSLREKSTLMYVLLRDGTLYFL